jgi:hypothetical protein
VSQPGLSVKFVVEALRRLNWTLAQAQVEDWTVCTYIRVHLWWASRWIRRLLVVTGARCPLTKPVVTAVEQQATTGPHCSWGVQPGGICVHVVQPVQREPTPGGPGGSGLRPGRKRFLYQLRYGSIQGPKPLVFRIALELSLTTT